MNKPANRPAVSNVMPAYNAAKTIAPAIASVLAQTFQDWELIVVDDCSFDDTACIVNAIGDLRIRIIRLEKNVRPAKARNIGIKYANGEWFAALDADDAWEPARLSVLMSLTKKGHFVTDVIARALPNDEGQLISREKSSTQPTACKIEELPDLASFQRAGGGLFPIFPLDEMRRQGILFPESGSGGDWAFLIAKSFASGLKCRRIAWPGYLYRVTGEHDSSTLKAIEEQYAVDFELSRASWVADDAKALIADGLVSIRRRLLVASLRERNWRSFSRYVAKNPLDAVYMINNGLQYVKRKLTF